MFIVLALLSLALLQESQPPAQPDEPEFFSLVPS